MENYPTYRSPVRILKDLGLSTTDISLNQLKLERKRLFLEIQLSKVQTTFIGNKEFSKNDVIELFEELYRVKNLDYHILISNHSTLLHLLENNRVEGSTSKDRLIQFNSEEETNTFREFLSPYLANSIDKLLSKAIQEKNFLAVQRIQIYFQFLTKKDSDFCFQKLVSFCETLNLRLEGLKNDQNIFLKGESIYLGYAPFYTLVNNIGQYHPSLPDTVANAVINFTLSSKKDLGRRKTLVAISDQASKLNCSDELKSIINLNRGTFSNTIEESESEKITIQGVFKIIVLIILGIYALLKIFGANDPQPSDDPFLKKLEQQRENNYQSDLEKNFDFTEAKFKKLHSTYVKIVESESESRNNTYKNSKPGIFSRYNAPKTGTKHTFKNKTNSDMIIAIWTDNHLNTFFVKRKKSIVVTSKKTSRIFFYVGTDWQTDKCLQSMTDGFTFTTISGVFAEQNESEFDFFRKYFTLNNQSSGDFIVTEENSEYVLYQGGRIVNYQIQ